MTEATPLETVFTTLCATHDLTTISIEYSPKWAWRATCHWVGFSNDGLPCATSECRAEGHTPESAIADVLANAAKKRTPLDSNIPALSINQVPA